MFKLLWCFIVGHRRTRMRMRTGVPCPLIEMREPWLQVGEDSVPGLHLEIDYCSRCGLVWGEVTTPRERGFPREIQTIGGKVGD